MTRRIPADAFDYYFVLGSDRSYQKVADHYGVTKRAVTKRATRDRWQERVVYIERRASEGAMRKAIETTEARKLRISKALRFLMSEGLQGLKKFPISSAKDAMRALVASINLELSICGDELLESSGQGTSINIGVGVNTSVTASDIRNELRKLPVEDQELLRDLLERAAARDRAKQGGGRPLDLT